jgi:hypothetical protein
MGKSPKLPDNTIRRVREGNRRLIKKHRDFNAAVRAIIKKEGKPKDKDKKREINRKAYRTIIGRNPLLKNAVKENIAKTRRRMHGR